MFYAAFTPKVVQSFPESIDPMQRQCTERGIRVDAFWHFVTQPLKPGEDDTSARHFTSKIEDRILHHLVSI